MGHFYVFYEKRVAKRLPVRYLTISRVWSEQFIISFLV